MVREVKRQMLKCINDSSCDIAQYECFGAGKMGEAPEG
jgi:hypothetical protein